jgi:hypothetical protein
MRPYIQGIRVLNMERPWLTLSDTELFLQGWFQAQRVLLHSGCIESRKGALGDSFDDFLFQDGMVIPRR